MSNVDASKYAGEVLKRLIKESNVSQEAFAEEFYMDVRTLSRYVNQGIRDVDKLQKFALYFNVKMQEFLPE